MLNFEVIAVGPLGCNCVLLWDAESKIGVAVDTGDETERIAERANHLNLGIKAILLTHAHFDHVGSAAPLQNLWGCPVFLHTDDIPLLERINEQTAIYGLSPIQKPDVTPMTSEFSESSELPLGIKT